MSVLRRTNGLKAWEQLQACGHVDNRYACGDAPAYHALVRRMEHDVQPPLQLAQLELPMHTRVLAYGNSFLKQLVHELACAGRFVLMPGPRDEACPYLTTHHQLHDRARNVTITVVANSAPLQHSSTLETGTLASWLATRALFDLVYYMPAHADCFFQVRRETCANESSLVSRPCINLSTASATGSTNRDASVWRLLAAHARLALIVRAWMPRTLQPDTSRSNGSLIFDPSKLINDFSCQVPSCAPVPSGHQCMHSGIALAARELATWSRRRVPEETR